MVDLSNFVADLSALTVRGAAELAGVLKERWKDATWTYDEIDREWLAGAKIAAPRGVVPRPGDAGVRTRDSRQ